MAQTELNALETSVALLQSKSTNNVRIQTKEALPSFANILEQRAEYKEPASDYRDYKAPDQVETVPYAEDATDNPPLRNRDVPVTSREENIEYRKSEFSTTESLSEATDTPKPVEQAKTNNSSETVSHAKDDTQTATKDGQKKTDNTGDPVEDVTPSETVTATPIDKAVNTIPVPAPGIIKTANNSETVQPNHAGVATITITDKNVAGVKNNIAENAPQTTNNAKAPVLVPVLDGIKTATTKETPILDGTKATTTKEAPILDGIKTATTKETPVLAPVLAGIKTTTTKETPKPAAIAPLSLSENLKSPDANQNIAQNLNAGQKTATIQTASNGNSQKQAVSAPLANTQTNQAPQAQPTVERVLPDNVTINTTTTTTAQKPTTEGKVDSAALLSIQENPSKNNKPVEAQSAPSPTVAKNKVAKQAGPSIVEKGENNQNLQTSSNAPSKQLQQAHSKNATTHTQQNIQQNPINSAITGVQTTNPTADIRNSAATPLIVQTSYQGQQQSGQNNAGQDGFSKNPDTGFSARGIPTQAPTTESNSFLQNIRQGATAQTQNHNASLAHSVRDQVKVNIQRAVDEGNDRIRIQLHPRQLGRIEVSLDLAKSGQLHIILTADRPETLDLLQRDQRELQQALQNIGLDAQGENLKFALSGGQQNDDNEKNQSGTKNQQDSQNEQELTSLEPQILEQSFQQNGDGRINIRV